MSSEGNECQEQCYIQTMDKWCQPCINSFKKNVTISEDEKIDAFIQKTQKAELRGSNPYVFEWIPYSQFGDIKIIGKGGFATVNSAIWKDGPLNKRGWTRKSDIKVALKCLNESQNISKEFLNEVEAHSIKMTNHILRIYGISQNPDTKDYIMVLEYVEGGNFNDWANKNYKEFDWKHKMKLLVDIMFGLKEIHQKQMVHRDFHTGNILIKTSKKFPCISDMGLCGKVGNLDETKVYGVMPYVAPEVLKGNPYTQAADIYSLGMIMYFIATGKQPFDNCAHDQYLVLNICNGIRPKINELEAPKCYIDLMNKCLDSNPNNRPNANDVFEQVVLFYFSSYAKNASGFNRAMLKLCKKSIEKEQQHYEIEKQFKEAEEYRKENLLSDENLYENSLVTHSQAIYTSRSLDCFTKNLPKYDNIDNCSVEIVDFTQI